MSDFLITWKEAGWPYENIKRMLKTLGELGSVEEPWRIQAHTKAKIGNRVWLLKQGKGPKGIFGVGSIASEPYRNDDQREGVGKKLAVIHFTTMVDPLGEMLISESATRRILTNQQMRTQASGITLSEDQSQALEELLRTADASTASSELIAHIANKLNLAAKSHRIGNFSEIRQSLVGRQISSNVLFDPRTTEKNYAFHWGGRGELQFNIGFDGTPGSESSELRYGVAFSFQLGRNLPSIEVLLPKVRKFNEFIRLYPEHFENMKMWIWADEDRSKDFAPSPISVTQATPPNFIFFGKRQPLASLDYEEMLSTFDRLLPVYEYVESQNSIESQVPNQEFKFKPGLVSRKSKTSTTLEERYLDISLRHNLIQKELYRQLISRHGDQNVGTELSIGIGAIVDVGVLTPEGFHIYEIKTGTTARACLREAVGQLLEYALWPGSPAATELVVVGECPLDDPAKDYLARLNRRFPLPIRYEHVLVPALAETTT